MRPRHLSWFREGSSNEVLERDNETDISDISLQTRIIELDLRIFEPPSVTQTFT